MKDFLFELWDSLIDGDWVDKTLSIIMFILIGVVLFLVGLLIFILFDSSGENKIGKGIIISKSHSAAYTTFAMIGKTMVPIYHPESWDFSVNINGKTGSISTNEDIYGLVIPPIEVKCEYSEGTMSDGVYIKSIKFN